MTQDKYHFYYPQWNEHDKPTVGCPHIKGQRIGSEYCHKQRRNLAEWIDEPYRIIVKCRGVDPEVWATGDAVARTAKMLAERKRETEGTAEEDV